MPLLGEGQEGLCEEGDALCVDRYLALACSEDIALNADDITDIPLFLELLEKVCADIVGTNIYLYTVGLVADVDEVSLAHISPAHDTACDTDDILVKLFKLGSLLLLVVAHSSEYLGFLSLILSLVLCSVTCNVELCDSEGVVTQLAEISQLVESVLLEYIYILSRLLISLNR